MLKKTQNIPTQVEGGGGGGADDPSLRAWRSAIFFTSLIENSNQWRKIFESSLSSFMYDASATGVGRGGHVPSQIIAVICFYSRCRKIIDPCYATDAN